MTDRPIFITLTQLVSVFNSVRKIRSTVAKGEMTPSDAVELRHLMDVMEREFELSAINNHKANDNKCEREFERDVSVLRAVMAADLQS